MEGKQVGVDFVYAPRAIADPELQRNVYGAGDVVPMADAIKYGLVPAPDDEQQPAATKPAAKRGARTRSKRGPVEDRAKRLDEDRGGDDAA